MKFKFPALQQVVAQAKSLPIDNIKQYIYIHNGYAITFNTPVLIVNLYEYVKRECDIEDEDELDELKEILSFLEGRAIPASVWKELTKVADVTFDPDNEELIFKKVEHKTSLILEENNIGLEYFKKDIKKYIELLTSDIIAESSQAYSGPILTLMGNVFKNEIKSDSVLLTRCYGTSTVKFQLNNKDYIYGLFNINMEFQEQIHPLTSELNIGNLIDDLKQNLKIDKFKDPIKVEVKDHPFQVPKIDGEPIKAEVKDHPFQVPEIDGELFKD